MAARKANLKLNINKCSFGLNSVTYMGDVVSEEGLKTDPKKVEASQNISVPQCKKDVQGF